MDVCLCFSLGRNLAKIGSARPSKPLFRSRPLHAPTKIRPLRSPHEIGEKLARSVGNVAVPHVHKHDEGHCHAGESADGHHALGCCSHSGLDTQLSLWLKSILIKTGVLGVVRHVEHSGLTLAISAAAFIVSGALGNFCCGTAAGMQATVPVRHLALWIVFVLSGVPMFVGCALRMAKGEIDAHVLMALAVFGSVYLGLPNEGALLLILYQLAHMLEDKFTRKAVVSLETLFNQIPDSAILVKMLPSGAPDFSATKSTGVESVPVGSHILIRPGEQVPLDGEVVYGCASITVDHISGESLPIHVKNLDRVAAGSRNNDGILVLVTTHTYQESTPARIVKMAADAQDRKPDVQKWIDGITSAWSKGVILAGGLVLLGCMACGVPFSGARGAFYRSMGVITAGAPCGLLLAPLAYVCALANASRRKVLVKGAAVLDLLHGCTSVGLDKTGTLTQGSLTCTAIYSSKSEVSFEGKYIDDSACKELLGRAVALSQLTSHPVAQAVARIGKKLGTVPPVSIKNFKSYPGEGVAGTVDSPNEAPRQLYFGSLEFVAKFLPERLHKQMHETIANAGYRKSISILLEQSGKMNEWAVFCFEDELRTNSADAVSALRTGSWKTGNPISSFKKNVVMLTGDAGSIANEMASTLAISSVHAGLKPEQKLKIILSNSQDGCTSHNRFVMVGDGLNDAPALSAADVGIAIASTVNGPSASVANVVILNGQGVGSLPFLFHLADKTRQIVLQNLILVFASMVVAIAPTVAGFFPLWLAVVIHEGTTILTAINSLRLLIAQPSSYKRPAVHELKMGALPKLEDDKVEVAVE